MNKFYNALGAFFLWLLLACFGSMAMAQPQTAPLLDATQLNALLELPSVRVVDIRPSADYEAGHIPGALSAPYGSWRGPAHNPGELISPEDLEELVQGLGIDAAQHVVVYSSGATQTDFGAAARVYWTLKYAGLPHLSVLDGGFEQWQQAKLPTSKTAPTIIASDYQLQLNNDIVISQAQLLEQVTTSVPSTQIIDARPQNFYEGQTKAPTASVPGTIAGAHNAPHQQWFQEGKNVLKSPVEIQRAIKLQGLDQATETVSFCNTGHWAATNWFVLSEIGGVKNVRLYPASLAEWTQTAEALPMDNTPGRAAQIRQKFQELWSSK